MENCKFNPGDIVIFIGSTDEQVRWGSCDDPRKILTKKTQIYTIEKVDIHTWHTKLTLVGIIGKFNSVCFKKIMTIRTYTQKDGTIWEWDETPKLVEYIKNLHNSHGNTDRGAQVSKEEK